MQAITTKYIGATNTKPSRIKAITESGLSLTIPYDSGRTLDGRDCHASAAEQLARKLKWGGVWVGGGIQGGYAFVCVDERNELRFSAD